MATPPSENPNPDSLTTDPKSLILSYTKRLWRSFVNHLPSPTPTSSPSSPTSPISTPPQPLPAISPAQQVHPPPPPPFRRCPIRRNLESSRLSRGHHPAHPLQPPQYPQELLFWEERAEGTNVQKVSFMVLERGPRAFVNGTFQIVTKLGVEGSPFKHISHSASETISANIAVLTSLQRSLATFLTQVYREVDKYGQLLNEDPEKSLSMLLVAINSIFLKLEGSIGHPPEIYKSDNSFSAQGGSSCALLFEKIPEMDQERSQWSVTEMGDATNLIYENLQRLDSYLSFILSSCQKPSRMTLYWLHYTCGAVGLSACSIWLLRHSSIMGSSDIDNWIREVKESSTGFWKEHVEQPLISIRDELFETFRRRHKGVMEVEEVQLTSNSLHRMLLAFSEQTKGQKLPENLSDQEMMEIVVARYEKELMHPLTNLFSGELARAMLIQIQKLKLDLETAMLELDQILKANEINFAILAALPAFFLSLLLLMLVRAWVLKDKGAEGRGRIARIHRRLLVVEVEKRIMQFHTCMDQGMEEDAECMFGLVLYSLDRLYKSVERHAKLTGEWRSLRQDLVDIGKPDLDKGDKLAIIKRVGSMYHCLLPSSNRR
ncbi:protein DGS1, mitochondrial-like isoform X1 [Iris pallida]|uniref:Protein DGS1, mitochondrial-like isoform X1 n=1 Tax=Iris pallida TaxID=29817 RepID=A0AAX6IJI0_IRIPA|nr:protein DGS1, mitochondrial-like isoform X1 [Iris pallida]